MSTVLDKSIDRLTEANTKLRKKVKSLSKTVLRSRNSVTRLQGLLKELQAKNLLSEEPAAVMSKCFSGTLLDIVENEAINRGRESTGLRYSQEVKEFAATLHYYSPQAYEYCQSVFKLPNVSSIRNWISNVNCEPGFLDNVLDVCQKSQWKDFSLVLDSMALKKQTSYANGKFAGFCDYGGLVAEDSESLCTEALVFLLVPLEFSKQQFPVGYFLVDKVNSQVQMELVNTILDMTAQRGIRIRNITCDGAAANQTMLSKLGCILNPLEPKPYFKHPHMDHNVYGTLDICHMMKLARNALAEYGTFYNQDEERICWSYIADMANVQERIGLHMANKVTSKHINWRKQKMKVKLAAQTFSRSVAGALAFLHDSKIDGFVDCMATIEFIRQVYLNTRLSIYTSNKNICFLPVATVCVLHYIVEPFPCLSACSMLFKLLQTALTQSCLAGKLLTYLTLDIS